MQSKFEIDYNIKCFEEKKVYLDDRLFENIKQKDFTWKAGVKGVEGV